MLVMRTYVGSRLARIDTTYLLLSVSDPLAHAFAPSPMPLARDFLWPCAQVAGPARGRAPARLAKTHTSQMKVQVMVQVSCHYLPTDGRGAIHQSPARWLCVR